MAQRYVTFYSSSQQSKKSDHMITGSGTVAGLSAYRHLPVEEVQKLLEKNRGKFPFYEYIVLDNTNKPWATQNDWVHPYVDFEEYVSLEERDAIVQDGVLDKNYAAKYARLFCHIFNVPYHPKNVAHSWTDYEEPESAGAHEGKYKISMHLILPHYRIKYSDLIKFVKSTLAVNGTAGKKKAASLFESFNFDTMTYQAGQSMRMLTTSKGYKNSTLQPLEPYAQPEEYYMHFVTAVSMEEDREIDIPERYKAVLQGITGVDPAVGDDTVKWQKAMASIYAQANLDEEGKEEKRLRLLHILAAKTNGFVSYKSLIDNDLKTIKARAAGGSKSGVDHSFLTSPEVQIEDISDRTRTALKKIVADPIIKQQQKVDYAKVMKEKEEQDFLAGFNIWRKQFEAQFAFIKCQDKYIYVSGMNAGQEISDKGMIKLQKEFHGYMGKKKIRYLDYWDESPGRNMVEGARFHVNPSWLPQGHVNKFIGYPYDLHKRETNPIDKLEWLLKFLRDTFMYEADYNFFMQWCAKKAQTKTRVEVMIVIMSKQTGTGKSTIQDFVGSLFQYPGTDKTLTARFASLDALTKNFNAQLSECVYVYLEEIKCTAQFDYDALKQLVTGRKSTIEKKGQDSYTQGAYFDIIASSNNEVPIKIPDEDRRIAFLQGTNVKREKSVFKYYFDNIQDNPDVLSMFWEYVKGMKDLPEVLEPPRNETRNRIVGTSVRAEVKFLFEYCEVLKGKFWSTGDLVSLIARNTGKPITPQSLAEAMETATNGAIEITRKSLAGGERRRGYDLSRLGDILEKNEELWDDLHQDHPPPLK